MDLQRFNYEIEHIDGEDNLWADLMKRWGAPIPSSDSSEIPITEVRRIKSATIPEVMRVAWLQREFKWANLDEIKKEQQKWLNKEEFININSEGLVVTMSGKEE